MWKHSLLFRNTKDAEGSCSHWRSLECRLRESGLALSFPPIRKYSEEFLLCSSKSSHAECFVSLVQVHFICEKTMSTFFFVVSKTSRVAREMPSSFRFVPGILPPGAKRMEYLTIKRIFRALYSCCRLRSVARTLGPESNLELYM